MNDDILNRMICLFTICFWKSWEISKIEKIVNSCKNETMADILWCGNDQIIKIFYWTYT